MHHHLRGLDACRCQPEASKTEPLPVEHIPNAEVVSTDRDWPKILLSGAGVAPKADTAGAGVSKVDTTGAAAPLLVQKVVQKRAVRILRGARQSCLTRLDRMQMITKCASCGSACRTGTMAATAANGLAHT
jgi:hypothetical protein